MRLPWDDHRACATLMGLKTTKSTKSHQAQAEAAGGPHPAVATKREECAPSMALSVRSRLWAGLAAGVLAVAAPVAVTAGTAQATQAVLENL